MKEVITVTEDDGTVRIDKFMAEKFPIYSRAAITKLFVLNLIKRGGVSLKQGEKVRPGTEIEYDLGPLAQKPEVIDLPIVYEDANVIVVNKPTGIISHARGKFWQEASVASFIRDKVTTASDTAIENDVQDPRSTPDRAGIVHRLDRATSGVMICAKNEETLSYLQKQFQDRKVTKKYVAIVRGGLEHNEATIDAAIARNTKDPKRFMVTVEGKHARTDYIVTGQQGHYTKLDLTPLTGRTHQLRLHLLHIQKPIVGDELYGGEDAPRLMLHAQSLSISIPTADGAYERTTFTAPLPHEFTEYVSI